MAARAACMSNPPTRALREEPRRVSPIWVVPLVAAAIGLWMVWHGYATRGELITIVMETAEGVESGKTLIKARDVAVGKVESVRLSEDLDHIVVTARINPDAQQLLRQDTQFWVVKPRIGREGISGLTTFMSGAYIQVQPGEDSEPRFEFVALETPPATFQDAAGLRLQLTGERVQAAKVGDPVDYQGYSVGRVESAEFDVTTRKQTYRIYIQAPYTALVTTTTRFWTSSGIKLSLGAQGVTVDSGSAEALLGGGISFDVPEGLGPGQEVDSDAQFVLYPDRDAARQGRFDRHIAFVLMVDGSVRGLSPGAPVEYRGVRIGTVAEVPYRYTQSATSALDNPTIPVLIHIEPQRLDSRSLPADDALWRERFLALAQGGLRASLGSGNLLTGALLVNLDFVADSTPPKRERYQGVDVFPSVQAGLGDLQQQLSQLLTKLNGLPVEGLLTQLQALAGNLNLLLQDPGTRAVPAALQQSLQDLSETLNGFSENAPAYKELNRLLRDLQPLIRTLDEQPNALIFKRSTRADPEPRAPQ